MSAPADCDTVKAAFPTVSFPSNCCEYDANNHVDFIDCRGGRVVSLSVTNLSLGGAVPSQVFQLTALEVLNLNKNKFTGSFPSGISNLPNLQEFDLSQNQHTGMIPDIFASNPKLRTFDLGDNSFTGTLPASLGTATGLTEIYVENNPLYGDIPSSWGNLQSLNTFWVQSTCLNIANPPGRISSVDDFRTGSPLNDCAAISAIAPGSSGTTATGSSGGSTQSSSGRTQTASGNASTGSNVAGSIGVNTAAPSNDGGDGSRDPTPSIEPSPSVGSLSGSGGSGISSGTVAAIGCAVGAVVVALLVAAFIALGRRRRRERSSFAKTQLRVETGDASGGSSCAESMAPGEGAAGTTAEPVASYSSPSPEPKTFTLVEKHPFYNKGLSTLTVDRSGSTLGTSAKTSVFRYPPTEAAESEAGLPAYAPADLGDNGTQT
ncbi:hypothetical protein DFJ73DRAFT_887473 [Zopfochytrium polystomum]|nr:hypothetical protein DFJ73DRAFT_887473 [Zopfochytrium polystomum]